MEDGCGRWLHTGDVESLSGMFFVVTVEEPVSTHSVCDAHGYSREKLDRSMGWKISKVVRVSMATRDARDLRRLFSAVRCTWQVRMAHSPP